MRTIFRAIIPNGYIECLDRKEAEKHSSVIEEFERDDEPNIELTPEIVQEPVKSLEDRVRELETKMREVEPVLMTAREG